MRVNSLPKTVTRQRRGCDFRLGDGGLFVQKKVVRLRQQSFLF